MPRASTFALMVCLLAAGGCSSPTQPTPPSQPPPTPTPTGPAPSRVFLCCGSDQVQLATDRQMSAYAAYPDGSTVDVTSRVTSWRSSDPAIASISATGLVHGAREGTVEFRASFSGLEGAWTWRVFQPAKAGDAGPDEVIGTVHEATAFGAVGIRNPRIQVIGGARNGFVFDARYDGYFRLDGLSQGGFDLLVASAGFRPLRVHVAQVGVDLTDALVMEPEPALVSDTLQGDVCDPRRTISTVFRTTVDGNFRVTSVQRTSVTLFLYEGSRLVNDRLFIGEDHPLADGHTYELRAVGVCDHGANDTVVTFLRPR